jgi:hypothetical protein
VARINEVVLDGDVEAKSSSAGILQRRSASGIPAIPHGAASDGLTERSSTNPTVD